MGSPRKSFKSRRLTLDVAARDKSGGTLHRLMPPVSGAPQPRGQGERAANAAKALPRETTENQR
jgi:hypothetical protein